MTSCRFSARGHYMSNIITDSESQQPISYWWSIRTFCLSLTVKKLLSFSFLAWFACTGRNFGGLGAADPQNFNCCDFDLQKAPPWVIPSLLGLYALKSVHWFGHSAIPRKKKSHKEHIWPYFTTPWGRHRLPDQDQIWRFCRFIASNHTYQF